MMSVPIIGIFISFASMVALSLLFKFERQRGVRILHRFRVHLDHLVERTGDTVDAFFGFVGRDLFRQSAHYFLHTILVGILLFLNRMKGKIEQMLRSNRLLARRVRRERKGRNKLDDIADHRAAMALTEDEKKQHKEKMLNG